jgi:hypothetical protein
MSGGAGRTGTRASRHWFAKGTQEGHAKGAVNPGVPGEGESGVHRGAL